MSHHDYVVHQWAYVGIYDNFPNDRKDLQRLVKRQISITTQTYQIKISIGESDNLHM